VTGRSFRCRRGDLVTDDQIIELAAGLVAEAEQVLRESPLPNRGKRSARYVFGTGDRDDVAVGYIILERDDQ
jgi:hypothetical protein